MNAWKVILSTLVIFTAGVITGVVITATEGVMFTRALRRSEGAPVVAYNRPPSGGSTTPWQTRNKDLIRRMDRELELTPEQHGHIERIMAASAERTKALWKPIAPLMNKEAQLTRAEIREQLTPEQRKKFEGFSKPRSGQDKHRTGTNSFMGAVTNTVSTNAIPGSP